MASPQSAQSFSVRPTSKFVIFAYATVTAATAIGAFLASRAQLQTAYLYAILAAGVLGLVRVAMRHMRLQLTRLSLEGTSLKFQDGVLSKSTRMLNLAKVQDVRVDQGIIDRLLGIGTLTLETAGETGRLAMPNVDRPHDIAQRILSLAHQAPATPSTRA